MAEKPTLHEEMLERVVAYYSGDLTPEDRAEFEAHLATCEGCKRALRLAQVALPVAADMLAFTPKRTIDEQVARFEAMWAEKGRAERAAGRAERPANWLRWGLAVGVVAAIAMLLFLWMGPAKRNPERDVYAPSRDGG